MKEKVLDYLINTYNPSGIMLYGSYADGLNDSTSDFDCMIFVDEKTKKHDDTVVNGITLDCRIYTVDEAKEPDPDEFLTAYDAEIVMDEDNLAKNLKETVKQYVLDNTQTDNEEKVFVSSWIEKSCNRILKNDDDSNFRIFELMDESLEDYYLLRDMFYFGSKKAIKYLKENDYTGYRLFHRAVTSRDNESIVNWLLYVAKYN